MLIETEIIVTDDYQTNIMGKSIDKAKIFIFEMEDVSGVLPGSDTEDTTIIFLQGRDLLINIPFLSFMKMYKRQKKCNDVFSYEG